MKYSPTLRAAASVITTLHIIFRQDTEEISLKIVKDPITHSKTFFFAEIIQSNCMSESVRPELIFTLLAPWCKVHVMSD